MIVSLSRATLFLSCFLAVASAQDRISFTDDLMPGCDEPGWLVYLVVDDITSEPVAGAEVFLVLESETPMAGEFWFTRKGATDENGVLRIPTEDIERQWHIQVLRHPDYGTCSRSGRDDEVWRIGPAFDVPVMIRDWQGRPSAGAKVGFCGGCGHCPDLANAVTDRNGIAVLRGIDPHNHIRDVYVQQPGLGLGYDSIRWFPGGPPSIIDCSWSIPFTGRVVDHLGQPVAGAHVGTLQVHRGPWGRTSDDGAFTVMGGDPESGPYHVRTAAGRKVYFPAAGRYPVTLQLPDLSDPDAHQGTIDVAEWQEPEVETRKVRVRFESSGEVLTAAVRLPGTKPIPGEGDTIDVPVSGPFSIEFYPEEKHYGLPRKRTYPFDDAADLPPEPIVLRWFSPTRVVGRVVDTTGEPVAVTVNLLTGWKRPSFDEFGEQPDGRFDLNVTESGLEVFDIVPKRADLRRRGVWVALPWRGQDRRVDLGEIVLSGEPQLIVSDADGPMVAEEVRWSRSGYQQGGRPRSFELDSEGCWDGPDLREGDSVLIEQDGDELPWRTVLRGAGPWKLEAPAGKLDVRAKTSDGELVVPSMLFDDQQIDIKDALRLRRLRTGPLRFYVSARGYRTAVVDTVITAESHTIEVTLPAK